MIAKHWKTEPLAEHLGVTVREIEDATERGDLRPIRLGRTLLYPEPEALAWALYPNRGQRTRIYFIQEGDGGPIKIGHATNPERRLTDHQCGNPRTLRLLGSFAGRAYEEGDIHARFAELRLRGEWFESSPELRAYIAEVCP